MRSALFTVLAATTACVAPDDVGRADDVAAEQSVSTSELLSRNQSIRLQSGTRLITYGVTDDGFAIFQDGGTLYATPLLPRAPRFKVADVGAVQPTVLVVGRVVFVWTTQFFFGPGGTSPLVVWTALGGAKLATESSVTGLIATRATSASPDGREIVFVANATPDGQIGDLVAAAPDLSRRRTLVTGVQVAGSCLPLAGFDGQVSPTGDPIGLGFGRAIVAGYCLAGETTATLTRWDGNERVDLQSQLPAPPFWSSNASGSRFAAVSGPAGATTAKLVTAGGKTTELEATPAGQAFFNYDGSTLVLTTAAGGNELHRYARGAQTPEVLINFGPGFPFRGHFTGGFRQYFDSTLSTSGDVLMYTTGFNPDGTSDINLVDISKTPARTVQLTANQFVAQSFELFTADSSHGLYYQFEPPAFNPTLYAGSFAGGARKVSSGAANEFVHFALAGTDIVYSDNLNGTGVSLFDVHDIMRADVGAAQITPSVAAAQVYNLYFVTRDRRAIVYTSDADPRSSGLFIKRVR